MSKTKCLAKRGLRYSVKGKAKVFHIEQFLANENIFSYTNRASIRTFFIGLVKKCRD
jgi:hypothetical protein